MKDNKVENYSRVCSGHFLFFIGYVRALTPQDS